MTRKVRFEADTTISVSLEKAKVVKKSGGTKPARVPDDADLKDSPF